MLKINLFDESFRHAHCSSFYNKPTHFEFVRDVFDWDGVTIFVDDWILNDNVKNIKSKVKIAWLLEPKVIKPNVYENIFYNNFDFIISHDNDILQKYEKKSYFCPVGTCWVDKNDQQIYHKSQIISVVASDKKETLGHKLRHKIIELHNNIDLFGRGYNPIEKKISSLKDYMFQIVVENCSVDGYFTEKIMDCFATGTIPIYWGCKNIGDFFDTNGILQFKNLTELELILKSLNQNLYLSKINSIQNNFKKFIEYEITEDYMYKNILNKIMRD